MSELKKYTFDGSSKLKLASLPTNSKKDGVDKEKILEKTMKNQAKIAELQERLYADGREGLIILLQAMDAAGKDSTIKHVLSGVNPQGIDVFSFKTPSADESAHDFLWRVHRSVPARGKISLFNRSYYEDVLVVRVHKLNRGYHMSDRVIGQKDKDFFEKRFKHICGFEDYLYENSYRFVKIFLNVSEEKQKERFLERIDKPDKNWKFSSNDLKERELWPKYQKAYEDAINHTATPENPWYVLPADQKWYTRYLVSEAILKALEEIDPQYPEISDEERERLKESRIILAGSAEPEEKEEKEKKEKKEEK